MAAAYNSTTQYSRRYEDLRGVDLTSGQAQVSPRRFAWAQNMWRDYSSEQGGAIETVPGFRMLGLLGGKIHGIWEYRPTGDERYVVVHAGTHLKCFRHDERDNVLYDQENTVDSFGGLADADSSAFVYNGRFYILDGTSFKVFMKEDGKWILKAVADAAYLPVTYLNGEMYEQRNMLLDRTINRETQASDFDIQSLYKYRKGLFSSGLGGGAHITGFADKRKADAVVWVSELKATDPTGTYDWGTVGTIAENAFAEDQNVKKVVVGQAFNMGVDETPVIDTGAFFNCSKLEFVALYNTTLREYAFVGCEKLKEIQLTLDHGQTLIYDKAFEGCDNIEKLTFKVNAGWNNKLPDSPFGELSNLKELAIDAPSSRYEPPAFISSGADYDETDIKDFPYAPRPNSKFDANAEVTLDNFPYVLKPNPNYSNTSGSPVDQDWYEIVEIDVSNALKQAGYVIVMSSDIDWTNPSNYNQLPFLLEEKIVEQPSEDDEGKMVKVTRYRAAIEYKVTGTFGNLDSLEKVYLPSTLEDLEAVKAAFELCTKAEVITDDFPDMLLKTATKTGEGVVDVNYIDLRSYELVAYDPATDVLGVEIDGEPVEDYGVSYALVDDEWLVDRVMIWGSASTDDPLTNHELDITLKCVPGKFNTAEGYADFITGNTDYKGTTQEAITKCTISATFDGRIFLTGNPALPNTVFYCQRDDTGHPNPTYWGVLNYINDGVGQSPNVAMLATANNLMVLKGNDPHDATIYYHAGLDSGNDIIPRIYPSERGLSGVGCLGIAVNFRDDAVFLSSAGLEAVGKQQVNLERTLAHRSSMVDRMLTREDLTQAAVAEWEGYLMIFTPSGNVYMADSRQTFNNGRGELEYEWYHMVDVGYYADQTADYEQVTGDGMLYDETGGHWLSEEAFEAYAVIDGKRYPVAPMPDAPEYVPNSTVWTSYLYKAATGNAVWHTDPELTSQARLPVALFGDQAYIMNETERMSGGTFRPVTAVANVEGVLYMGTADGRLLCFNTDKRDVAVDDEQPPAGTMHRSWYTFAGRQIDSFITTAYDDGGYPDLAKKTVKKSMVLHSKTFPGTRLEVRVRTNRNDEWRTVGSVSVATYDFFSTDYASAPLQLADETLSTIREKEKKWALKQLYIGSVGFRAPWGLYDMGYRFTVTGRIKT